MEDGMDRAALARWFADEDGDVSAPEEWALAHGDEIGYAAPSDDAADGIWYRLHGLLPSPVLMERLTAMPHASLLALGEWARRNPRSMLFRKLERLPQGVARWQADFDRRRETLAESLGDEELVEQLLPPAQRK
ncbi:hypothetical protein CXB49_12000 [Chromobacterium sp. ATCC 53434]|uniref:hypothetical protein n=2 Tax=Chromobacterium TaxID=535 RepID=UPI000C77CCA9|nr:hypothetical protein [Chromobacterium sp. ATCC 53434]AUH51490.1 hypothetical protein CXB49_12000 [Chromobacterium sp. ATCC 53434]